LEVARLFALFQTGIARICEYVGFFAAQQILDLGDVIATKGCQHGVWINPDSAWMPIGVFIPKW
jgi:hypothetical protein